MRLYLDDIRTPKHDYNFIARSYEDAIEYVKSNNIPSFISFDHDLGIDEFNELLPTGYDFAKWLVEMDMNDEYQIPDNFTFNVHSANPVGKANIESYLNNYLNFRKNK